LRDPTDGGRDGKGISPKFSGPMVNDFKAVASSDESIALGTDADRNITAACGVVQSDVVPGTSKISRDHSRREHAGHVFGYVPMF
jgi:hypothetical protein